MSPEQARGQALDHRTDLFSLGCVLYAMCSGRSPFRTTNAWDAIARVCNEPPPSLSDTGADTPDWLIEIIEKLLAKDADDRYQSAAEVAELLGQHLAQLQQPGAMAPRKRSLARSRTTKRARPRLPVRLGIVAAAMLLLVGTLGVTEATGVTQLAATVIRIFRPEGTLEIVVDDPNVKVAIDGEDIGIQGAGPHEVHLRLGAHQVQALANGKPVYQDLVTINRSGKQIVKIGVTPPARSATQGKLEAVPNIATVKAFRDGDSITITEVKATSPELKAGDKVVVKGHYTLASQPEASLCLFATATKGPGIGPIRPGQKIGITRGQGEFELSETLDDCDGRLHVTFYSVPDGKGFGGLYFGTAKQMEEVKRWNVENWYGVSSGGSVNTEKQPAAAATAGAPATLAKIGVDAKPITKDGVFPEKDAWRIGSLAGRTVRLFEIPVANVEDCLLTYRAKLKAERLEGRAYLEMWCRLPGGEFFSKGLNNPATGTTEWATYETPFFLKKGERCDLAKLNVVIEGKGTLWIKDVELLKGPLPGSSPMAGIGTRLAEWLGSQFAGEPQTVAAAKQVAIPDTVVEGVGWGGFQVGATREELTKAFGPLQRNPAPGSQWTGWISRYHIDCWFDQAGRAVEVRFNQGFKFPLTSGVKIGSSEKEVLAAYGVPNRVVNKPQSKMLEYRNRGVLMWVIDGKVFDFTVFKPQAAAGEEGTDTLEEKPVPGNSFLAAQLREAKAGNFWAKYRLWAAYHKGTDGVEKNPAEAQKWLAEVVQGVYLATFRPVKGFAPRTPGEFLAKFHEYSTLHSEKTGLGGTGFFRTKVKDGTLVGSFLTAYPDKMRQAIAANPSLKLISIQELTPEMFIAYEASPQESLNAAGGDPQSGVIRAKQQAKAHERMRQDTKMFSAEDLREIESLYQVANQKWQTQEARDSLKTLTEKYEEANRTGCAILYLGQIWRLFLWRWRAGRIAGKAIARTGISPERKG
jgi:hypothetical protein